MLNTANIVNIHDKHENKVDINSEMESADDFVDGIDNLGLSKLSIILLVGKFCLPNLETARKIDHPTFLCQKISFTQPISLRYQPLCK